MDWFARQLLDWHALHGRKDLPWQQDINPYRVWVSEIMLQQTQVATVIDYYLRFMSRFTDVASLASAPLDEVLHHWTGLGYYARARNLHKAAGQVMEQHQGEFPTTQEDLEALPGIGRSTAGAIRAISMQQPATILDGNVKRVLTRFHAIGGYPGTTAVSHELWQIAEEHTPHKETATYTQAIMDLGATLCVRRRPACEACPLVSRCAAREAGTVDQYPEPKPKKEKPVQRARFFVVTLPNQATLLEQKPLEGLWGGLWTPPQREADTESATFLAEIGADINQLERQHIAPQFRHTFTHYHLDIEPVYLNLKALPAMAEDNDTRRWVNPNQLDSSNERIGLSAPAVRLLASLKEPFPT